MTHQFQWDNMGYQNFEDWLARFRSRRRKEVRRERKVALKKWVQYSHGSWPQMTPAIWSRLRDFYEDTTARKYAEPYLKPAFSHERCRIAIPHSTRISRRA